MRRTTRSVARLAAAQRKDNQVVEDVLDGSDEDVTEGDRPRE